MSEYIVDFFGIGARLTERLGFCVPFVKALDKERKEPIVRCRDCEFGTLLMNGMYDCDGRLADKMYVTQVEPDGFCAWGERRRP